MRVDSNTAREAARIRRFKLLIALVAAFVVSATGGHSRSNSPIQYSVSDQQEHINKSLSILVLRLHFEIPSHPPTSPLSSVSFPQPINDQLQYVHPIWPSRSLRIDQNNTTFNFLDESHQAYNPSLSHLFSRPSPSSVLYDDSRDLDSIPFVCDLYE